ncbi:MAG: glycosyltransferase [Chromatiaceae bacterium]|nr:glycosyltransferase [Chromatiaceae bacterium]
MKYLFVYSCLSVGGVETLIVRLSSWLSENGHNVTIILSRHGELDKLLDSRVGIYYFNITNAQKHIYALEDDPFDAVCCFDPSSMMEAAFLIDKLDYPHRFFVGIYHPRIFFFLKKDSPLSILRRRFLEKFIPNASLAFMNEACRLSHQSYLDSSLEGSFLMPLAVKSIKQRKCAITRKKIVSIGRLTPFKTYNLYLIEIVSELIKNGHKEITWHVYGDGPLEEQMQLSIRRYNLDRHIFLHGRLPYENFSESISDAHLFVGMGSSLIEAGMLGIPGIPAIDSAGPYSYGYTYNLNGYDVGEFRNRLPQVPVYNLIENVFNMTNAEYQAEGERTRLHCERFSITSVGTSFVKKTGELGVLGPLPFNAKFYLFVYVVISQMLYKKRMAFGLFLQSLKTMLPHPYLKILQRANRKVLARSAMSEKMKL